MHCVNWGVLLGDGEEEVGSGIYALRPSRTAKCWRKPVREGRDALGAPANRLKAGGGDYYPMQLCKNSVMIPMEKESWFSPPALPSLLGALWDRQCQCGSLCSVLHEGNWEGCLGYVCLWLSYGWGGGCEVGFVPMGMWQRSHGTSSITVTRGAPAWAVSVRLGQPAEELGLQLQHNPFTGNLQGSKAPLAAGRDENPKERT